MSRRPRSALTALLALSIAYGAPALQAEESLGRLFFTPERRAALDRARQLNIQEQQQVTQTDVVTVNGIVTRSSGKRTAWVNGVPITEKASPGSVRVQPTERPTVVRVTPGEQAPSNVTVGTSVNRATGERLDGLQGGSISVKRGAP